jgi:hypothetical protein
MFSTVYPHTEAGGISISDSEYRQTTHLLISRTFRSDAPQAYINL